MKLLQQFNKLTADKTLNEEGDCGGAVTAGAISGGAMPLFSKLVAQSTPKVKTIKWSKKMAPRGTPYKKKGLGLKEAFSQLTEAPGMGGDSGAMSMNMDGSPAAPAQGSSFDSAAVIAKLKSFEDRDRMGDQNTVTFGLEDEAGGIVRVSVSGDQSEEFEKAIQAFLAKQQQQDDDVPEIAEVLFKLKDKFDIVHVQWPDVQEDEEEDVSLQGGQEGAEGQEQLDLDGSDEAAQDQQMDAAPGADESQVKDLLTQVIDMMKADAEARKAEAKAREAEAKTKEADQLTKQITNKVKQEEQFLDMEKAEKAEKEQEREVKRLAKLARWKHEMGGDEEDVDAQEPSDSDLDTFVQSAKQKEPLPAPTEPQEEEESAVRPARVAAQPAKKQTTIRGRVHPHDIASFILSRVK